MKNETLYGVSRCDAAEAISPVTPEVISGNYLTLMKYAAACGNVLSITLT